MNSVKYTSYRKSEIINVKWDQWFMLCISFFMMRCFFRYSVRSMVCASCYIDTVQTEFRPSKPTIPTNYTNSMKHNPSWEPKSTLRLSTDSSPFMNPNVHCFVQKSLPPVLILSHMAPIHIPKPHFLEICHPISLCFRYSEHFVLKYPQSAFFP
jgi:hypothetical protein